MSNVPHTAQHEKSFKHYAEQKRTYPTGDPRASVMKARCDILLGKGKFKRMRVYVDPRTGERRDTAEIWF